MRYFAGCLTEYFSPGTGFFTTGLFPGIVDITFTGCFHRGYQLRWYGAIEDRHSFGGIIMVLLSDVRLVFDLETNHGMLCCIFGLQVFTESSKNFLVGFKSRRAMRGKNPDILTVACFLPLEALWIGLYPRRREVHRTVLPGGKPHQNQLDLVFTGNGYQRIHAGKVIFAFFRFDLVPKYRKFSGIAGCCFNRFKSFLDLGFITGAVTGLAQELGADGEKRLSIYHK